MREFLCLAGLMVLIVAHPQAVTDPTVSLSVSLPSMTIPSAASTSLNIPVTTNSVSFPTGLVPGNGTATRSHRSRRPHSEPVPIFSRECDCPNLSSVAYPCWATDTLQSCVFEELHSWVCWTSAAYGCPSPTRSCEALFTPKPITGKNPCELGPPETSEGAQMTAAPNLSAVITSAAE